MHLLHFMKRNAYATFDEVECIKWNVELHEWATFYQVHGMYIYMNGLHSNKSVECMEYRLSQKSPILHTFFDNRSPHSIYSLTKHPYVPYILPRKSPIFHTFFDQRALYSIHSFTKEPCTPYTLSQALRSIHSVTKEPYISYILSQKSPIFHTFFDQRALFSIHSLTKEPLSAIHSVTKEPLCCIHSTFYDVNPSAPAVWCKGWNIDMFIDLYIWIHTFIHWLLDLSWLIYTCIFRLLNPWIPGFRNVNSRIYLFRYMDILIHSYMNP